jgi:hypothetical protein
MSTFSFIENPILNVLNNVHDLLPGVEKVIAVYYSNEDAHVLAKCLLNISNRESRLDDLLIEDQSGMIEKLRKTNSFFSWGKKEDTPFEIRAKKKHAQMDVFHELENVVLTLGYLNEYDKKHDLFFFYFNQDLSNFGVSGNNKSLTPENKQVIGFLLYNTIKTLIRKSKKDISVLSVFNDNTKSLVKRYSQVKEELLKSKNNYGLSLSDLCKAYVKEFGESNRRFNYILTEDALSKIKLYQGDITELKNIIKKALGFVNNLYFDSTETDIYITEDYLNFEVSGAGTAIKPQDIQLYDRYSKTILLLDKFEGAARDVVAKNIDLTGANVGNACSTPISAPAISDAIKKHRNKIIHLLNKYPDRWKLIRSEFRPVKNVLILKNELIEKSA